MSASSYTHQDNLSQDQNQSKTKFPEDDISIERCPHDKENPYTMVRNELIRDSSISPDVRWLIIYLLSNKDGWKINVQHLINHLNPHMGRNKVYQLFEEAQEAGYMKKEQCFLHRKEGGSLKSGVKYIISEIPKFKKCFRRPENRDTGHRDTENRHPKKQQKNDIKNIDKKNDIVSSASSFAKAENNIVPFSPSAYRLRNGQPLSSATQKLFNRYMEDPFSRAKLLRNVKYYEDYFDGGGRPEVHEAYLQSCFTKDYGQKMEVIWQNDLYARMFKEEYQIEKMKILKTVVQFYKDGEITPISVSKSLPPQTFSDNLENFKRQIRG